MSTSLIKILSCSIFIAQQQNKKMLTILLKDYAKTLVNHTQFVFILILVLCYENHNIFINDTIYKILEKYIYIFGNNLCRQLIFMNNTPDKNSDDDDDYIKQHGWSPSS